MQGGAFLKDLLAIQGDHISSENLAKPFNIRIIIVRIHFSSNSRQYPNSPSTPRVPKILNSPLLVQVLADSKLCLHIAALTAPTAADHSVLVSLVI